MSETAPNEQLPRHLSALLSPRAYSHRVETIRLVQTHVSWVLLTGEYAYKIKRPVCYPFVDLRAPERRAFFCSEEVRLNRRFAPELYLGTCDITECEGQAHMGGEGRIIERAVKMRQFERGEELDELLERGAVGTAELEAFGGDLADIHAALPAAAATQAWGRPCAIRAIMLENLAQCASAAALFETQSRIASLRTPLENRVQQAQSWMASRFGGGQVRECHGDLHSRNIVRRHGRLIAFDCMEFEPGFRWLDVADEVSFLVADVVSRGHAHHAHAFHNGYLARSGDYEGCRFSQLYVAHRSLVRAKIAALSAAEAAPGPKREKLRREHERFLDCAARALAPPAPVLILMQGLSGSGKTWLARRLAPPLDAIHLRSDVQRKRLAGLGQTASSHSPPGAGLYSRHDRAQVYEHLLQQTRSTLAGGYSTIVDATFANADDRAHFKELATQLSVNVRIVKCTAPPEILRERIAARGSGKDASEADLAVLQWQQQHAQPPGADEGIPIIEAHTAEPDVETRVLHELTGDRTRA